MRRDPVWSTGDPSLLTDHTTGRIFCFYTSSVNAGYASSRTGNDPEDPNITQNDYSFSDDDGLTWQHRRITGQSKDPAWAGMFAASGEGLQLRHGPWAGRLIQQYVVRVNGGNYTVGVYSDDHGETWQYGVPVGPGADENKVSELSDGSVLLNVRARPRRLQAVSADGGVSYPKLQPVPEQVGSGNNGHITRLHPEAQPGSPESRVQVLSSTHDATIRRNLSLYVSFDDGATWPSRYVLDDDASAYSVITPLTQSRLGLLYEREAYATISYRELDLRTLNPAPLLLSIPDGTVLQAGVENRVTVSATNQGVTTLNQISLGVDLDGSESAPQSIPALPAGRTREVTVSIMVPQTVAGPRTLELKATAKTKSTPVNPRGGRVNALRSADVEVAASASAAPHPSLELTPCFDAVYPDYTAEGLVADNAVAWVRLRNDGNVPLTDVTVSWNIDSSPLLVGTLPPGGTATISSRTGFDHRLLDAEVAAGVFAPQVTASARAGDRSVSVTEPIPALDLRPRSVV
ncbi:exo-alpha-sialidase [Luteococcus sp. OSA5]|uniref:exo-alpha-sialidase n=1 Tax=Luteococcus sp. OSA5 TaxID=3401630 RepID=UPI003B4332BD